ncbi:MAG: hypothetical protein C0392_11380 [Syntrophus sp. (in: bacteria)]|nr:hypothetical protein [Syntrophus sp. (in: bacteria)]
MTSLRSHTIFHRWSMCGMILRDRWFPLRFFLGKIMVLLIMLFPFSLPVYAQILPNPNPVGNTITLSGTNSNSVDFTNYGTLANNMVNNLSNILNNSGTLNNQSGGTLSNFFSTLNNSGTLNNQSGGTLGNYFSTLMNNSGHLYNSGTINNFGSTLNNSGALNNTGILNNTSQLGGGTLNNSGQLYNSGTIDNSGGTLNNSGALYNSGTVNNIGSVNIIGDARGRLINSGTLINDGTLTNGIIWYHPFSKSWTNGTLDNTGTLGGIGTIIGSFNNNGIIAPGNSSIGTMTITGDYNHNAGATYQVHVDAAGQSSKLNITGTATLNGGTVSVLAGSGIYSTSTTYTILTAGTVNGTFANAMSNLIFLTPSLNYDANNAYLILARNSAAYSSVAATSNQATVASALDRTWSTATGDMRTIINNINSMNAQGARNAYNQVGGLSHTTLPGAALSSFNQYMGSLTGRMGGFATGGPTFTYTGRTMFASRSDVASDVGNALLALNNMNGKPATWGFWTRGYGNLGERRGNDVSSRYDYNTGGIIVGFDRKISNTLLLGASVGYSRTRVNMKDLSDNGTVSSYQGSLYGTYLNSPWYVNGILSYGYNRYKTSRDISFGSIMTTANADYAGQTVAAYTEVGYLFKIHTISIIPMASFQAGYLTQNSYTERDAGALNLAVDRNHTSSLLSSLGVKIRKDFATGAGTLTPEVRAKWLHEFSNDDYILNSAFAGAPASTFTVQGDKPNRDSIALGFGLTCVTKKSLSLFLAYDAIISGDHTEHGGSLGMRYRW